MIPRTGACARSWPIALSRSSRLTAPTTRPSSVTNTPLWPCRWQSTIASRTLSPGPTVRAGVDITSRARRASRSAPASAPRAFVRASSSPRRVIADAAPSWPPPPSAPASTDASSRSLRLRTTANTRPSISTSTTSARASVRSTILCARFEIPSTYSGQRSAATRTSSPPASTGTSASISAFRSLRSDSARGVCRYCETRSWRAPWRRHQASASTSRWVVVG